MRYIELLNQIEVEKRQVVMRQEQAESCLQQGEATAGLLRKKSNDMMSVVKKIERREALPKDDQVFLGHILAYQSRFMDAARVFERAGHIDLAIEMFLDLKRYDDAKNFAAKVRADILCLNVCSSVSCPSYHKSSALSLFPHPPCSQKMHSRMVHRSTRCPT